MRQQEAVAPGAVARVQVRFTGVDIEAGRKQLAIVERGEDRLVIEQRAAGGVHQHRPAGQSRERVGVDHAAWFRASPGSAG